jgi:hypothetical protein
MTGRNSWITQGREAAGFIDAAEFEEIEAEGDAAIQGWIDEQLKGTTVTVVLVGAGTCRRKWVRYEIERSEARGNGLLGIDVSKIQDLDGDTTERCGEIPKGYEFHLWIKGNGSANLGTWIEAAATAAGK